MRVSKYVKGNGGLDLCPIAGIQHRTHLVRLAPGASVVACENQLVSELTDRKCCEQPAPFIRQDDVAGAARLCRPPRDPPRRRGPKRKKHHWPPRLNPAAYEGRGGTARQCRA